MHRGLLYLVALVLLAACGTERTAPSPASSDSASEGARDRSAEIPAAVGPAAVLREYYAAISAREYRRAYLLWGDSGRLSNQTYDEFRAGFERTASVDVRVGEPGRIEGAAGSRYVEVPVELEATLHSGAAQRFTGSYTLRRSVVDGATDAQRQWHIYSADMASR